MRSEVWIEVDKGKNAGREEIFQAEEIAHAKALWLEKPSFTPRIEKVLELGEGGSKQSVKDPGAWWQWKGDSQTA